MMCASFVSMRRFKLMEGLQRWACFSDGYAIDIHLGWNLYVCSERGAYTLRVDLYMCSERGAQTLRVDLYMCSERGAQTLRVGLYTQKSTHTWEITISTYHQWQHLQTSAPTSDTFVSPQPAPASRSPAGQRGPSPQPAE